jgi:hypothetical protein
MGLQLSGLLLIACILFAISISEQRGKTVLYMILVMCSVVLVFAGAVEILPMLNNSSGGALAFDLALAAGAATALIHARRTRA